MKMQMMMNKTRMGMALLGLMCISSIMAQDVININRNGSAAALRSARTVVKPEGALEARAFDWNPRLEQLTAADRGATLKLDFFEGRQYSATIRRVAKDCDGVLGITAVLPDYDFAACFIAVSDAGITIAADIPEKDEHYSAVVSKGETILSRYSLLEAQRKEKPHLAEPAPVRESYASMRDATAEMRAGDTDELDDPVEIDVMVLYTAAAKQKDSQIDNTINIIFQKANLILENSQTFLTLNMVHKQETNYRETGDSHIDLNALLALDENGEVRALRRQYGADMVQLITKGFTDGSGGRAFLNMPYSVVQIASGLWTGYVHELGHNLGCGHSWQQKTCPGPGVFSYSSGHRGVDEEGKWFRTVMSYASVSEYADGQSTYEIPYFSNPDIMVKGVPVGDPVHANNALTIKQTKHQNSRYFEHVDTKGEHGATANEVVRNVSVWSYGGSIFVNVPTATQISVYTLLGSLVRRQALGEGQTVVPLPQGVYVVKVGEAAAKVVVR
jgi:hypothetical protein